MRLYVEVAKRGFRRHATYRGATVAGLFTNTVFGFIQAHVMLAIYAQRTDVGGFDLRDALTYVFVTQGFLMVVGIFAGGAEIGERIRSGDIVTDLHRPVDFLHWSLAMDLGRAAFHALARGVPPFLVGALAFDLRLPTSAVTVLGFGVALLLAVVASFALRFLLGMAAFVTLDDRGPTQVVSAVWMFFSGFILPVTFFPGWLEAVARALPFQVMVQIPVEIFLGQNPGTALVGALAIQVVWCAALLGAARVSLRAATRRVVVQGG